MTSLFSRLTSAPVRVRVKNAIGIRCTWSNTAVRRSRISPSPILADSQRVTSPSPASSRAINAISTASQTTVSRRGPVDDGVDDPPGEHRRGHREHRRDHAQHQEPGQHACGAAGRRRRCAAGWPWRTAACRPARSSSLYNVCHAVISMLMQAPPVRLEDHRGPCRHRCRLSDPRTSTRVEVKRFPLATGGHRPSVGRKTDEPVTVTECEDGPLLVRGPFTLLDPDGRPIDPGRRTVALCRCGLSSVKPFCDGSHKASGFRTGPG